MIEALIGVMIGALLGVIVCGAFCWWLYKDRGDEK